MSDSNWKIGGFLWRLLFMASIFIGFLVGIVMGALVPTSNGCARWSSDVREQVIICRPCKEDSQREQCIQDAWKPAYVIETCLR